MLRKLQEAGLLVKPEKCEFETQKTTFLGFVISPEGIEMDPEKVSVVKNLETPTCIRDVQCFLGFANFYRRFIEGFSRTCTPLYNLLKKKQDSKADDIPVNPAQHQKNLRKTPFLWNPACDNVFQKLKTKFCTATILKHFDPELETILETDASDYVVSGIVSQRHLNPVSGKLTLHPVAFLSEKISPAECNYGIGDKELLAILACLEHWHM